MADFNQSPLGQTSLAPAMPLTSFSTSSTDPVWQVPRWQAVSSTSLALAIGGGLFTYVRPLDGRIVPLRAPEPR